MDCPSSHSVRQRASSTLSEKLGSAGVGLACPGQRRSRKPGFAYSAASTEQNKK